MEEAIKNFPKQFGWRPEIKNKISKIKYNNFIVCGMGGSALAGDLLRVVTQTEFGSVRIWRDYGLPDNINKKTLIIASSYSGNTEETIDAFLEARRRGLPLAAITTGGKLLELAKKYNIPHIQIPNTNIQPRMATGFMITALMKLMRFEKLSHDAGNLPRSLNINISQRAGKALAEKLRGKIPIIYSSAKNFPLAYNWKIKFNETAKIPAFCNVFPELNHNEMSGFDFGKFSERGGITPPPTTSHYFKGRGGGGRVTLFPQFHFIFLEDKADDPRIIKRMKITKKLFEARRLEVRDVKLEGKGVLHKIFQNLLIVDWTAFYLAQSYGHDPEQVLMVEELKKMIK
ncbi:hypothetical protein A3G55_02610 [Candidatus Giovannonibacteria bacterium RIFCSPLOWO2_12_FULL_44_25]|uniref:Bifunctional phosphoglucose/phosphomannose isomerase n=3 Tax=Candidatus Giovannoniibacteriota TaxID=1752738 RepID=A0A0G1ICD7_9BACT|nr:MAG: Bifunctional phosphoglucose/phosphomannose isomerase [Parcubacteria group bacterium GW2011_GWC1_44_10]KKT57041.1 MAG: Bifunctional phosphoglucose/phosphomannose isomerase [Candidatus Giovannonibacteria bacterium GW2011_GWB1_44_23]KKT59478.1 MAG: Bifunctional phosphoglucose/phosphomannose isomerase [Candidatus Giovannonibacteria bacterium GW2011_GWA1_44_25]OGF49928.1 MAG: hypothetical protein A2120_04435 [Candidatus Giovannonibacteria bacterium GWA2_45_15]OGF60562.1 MAG: hypothetical pro